MAMDLANVDVVDMQGAVNMGKTRVVYNLIDADGCTYNTNYRKRVLHCLYKYQHIIVENGAKPLLTQSQKDLLEWFEARLLAEQEDFSMSEDEYKHLLADFEPQVKMFDKTPLTLEEEKRKTDVRLGKFIFHFIEYLEKIWKTALRKIYLCANEKLTTYIEKQKSEYNNVHIMLGSNRQAFTFDDLNKRERGTTSIYTELRALADFLQVKLEEFTLTDLHEEKIYPENNFKRILAGEAVATKNVFDDSKVNIIYAACHRAVDEHPNAEITINMWDDHSGILRGLNVFYGTHSELLPKGLILNLHKYDGELRGTKTIIGTGVVDKNYKKNTLLMAMLCGYDAIKNMDDLNIAKMLDVADFLKKRVIVTEEKEKVSGESIFKPKKATPPISRPPTPFPVPAQ